MPLLKAYDQILAGTAYCLVMKTLGSLSTIISHLRVVLNYLGSWLSNGLKPSCILASFFEDCLVF